MLRHRLIPLALLLVALVTRASAAAETHAFVTTTDFSSGGLRSIDLSSRTVSPTETAVFTDTRLRWYGGLLYVINRLGQDNIQVVDPATLGTLHQFSTGNGSNPADIAFASDTKAYVTLYARPDLLIMNPQTGASLGSIPLGAFADADGIPEMDHMEKVGPYLFVALQRLDEAHNFAPTDSSLVVVIDTRTDAVVDVNPALPGVQGFRLTFKNPVTPFAYDPLSGRLLIGCAGSYSALDGGVEWIDPVSFTSLGPAITEAALGGNISGIAWYTADHSYAVIYDASFNGVLVSWSANTGTKLGTLFSASGLNDLGLDDRNERYVCDGTFTAPGVRVWSVPADLSIAGPLDTGLPPNQITFDRVSGDVAGVAPAVAAVAFAAPWPNPARVAVALELGLARSGTLTVEVFDAAGRRVRTLAAGAREAGPVRLRWDLVDDAGRRVPAGLYLVRARGAGVESARRVVVLE